VAKEREKPRLYEWGRLKEEWWNGAT